MQKDETHYLERNSDKPNKQISVEETKDWAMGTSTKDQYSYHYPTLPTLTVHALITLAKIYALGKHRFTVLDWPTSCWLNDNSEGCVWNRNISTAFQQSLIRATIHNLLDLIRYSILSRTSNGCTCSLNGYRSLAITIERPGGRYRERITCSAVESRNSHSQSVWLYSGSTVLNLLLVRSQFAHSWGRKAVWDIVSGTASIPWSTPDRC